MREAPHHFVLRSYGCRDILIAILTVLFAFPALCHAQVSGNVGYAQNGGKARAVQNERNKRVLTKEEMPPTGTSTFVEANVLMNVRADEYVAVFGVLQEGETVAECSRKMDATIKHSATSSRTLGIADDARFVDFIAQNKIYGFEVTGEIAREKLVGFELKKNVSIHYKDPSLLDKIVLAASPLADLRSDQGRLHRLGSRSNPGQAHGGSQPDHQAQGQPIREATGHQAPAASAGLRGKIRDPLPTEMYDSYTAFESEHVGIPANRERLATQTARKSRTFYFNGLDADGFDAVINPVVIEPVVQFTLYLEGQVRGASRSRRAVRTIPSQLRASARALRIFDRGRSVDTTRLEPRVTRPSLRVSIAELQLTRHVLPIFHPGPPGSRRP